MLSPHSVGSAAVVRRGFGGVVWTFPFGCPSQTASMHAIASSILWINPLSLIVAALDGSDSRSASLLVTDAMTQPPCASRVLVWHLSPRDSHDSHELLLLLAGLQYIAFQQFRGCEWLCSPHFRIGFWFIINIFFFTSSPHIPNYSIQKLN